MKNSQNLLIIACLFLFFLLLGEFSFLVAKERTVGPQVPSRQINTSPPMLTVGETSSFVDSNFDRGTYSQPPFSVEFSLPRRTSLAKIELYFSKSNPPALLQFKIFQDGIWQDATDKIYNVFPQRTIYFSQLPSTEKIKLDILPNPKTPGNIANINEVVFYSRGQKTFTNTLLTAFQKTPAQIIWHKFFLANLDIMRPNSFWGIEFAGRILAIGLDLLFLCIILKVFLTILLPLWPKQWDRNWLIILIGLLIYISVISFLGIRQYQGFHYSSAGDPAGRSQAYWRSVNGEGFLYQNVQLCDCSNLLLGHMQWFTALLVPFYALSSRPETMIILQNLLVGLGVIAIYLIVLHLSGRKNLALFFSLFYLVYPFNHFISFNAFPEDVFAIPLILFAFYFFLKEKFWPFLIMAILITGTKELAGLIVASFGLLGLLWRRSLKWIFASVALGLLSTTSMLLILSQWTSSMTFALDQKLIKLTHPSIGVFSHLGPNPWAIIKNLLSNPIYYFSYLFSLEKINFLYAIFHSLGFLPILGSPILVITLSTFVKNHLLTDNSFADMVAGGRAFYLAPMLPGMILATIYGFNWLAKRWPRLILPLMVFLTFSTLYSAQTWSPTPLNRTWPTMTTFDVSPEDRLTWKFIKMVPPKEPLATDFFIFMPLANRSKIYRTRDLFVTVNLDSVNYVLLTNRGAGVDQNKIIKMIQDNPSWRLVAEEKGIYLWKKIN